MIKEKDTTALRCVSVIVLFGQNAGLSLSPLRASNCIQTLYIL